MFHLARQSATLLHCNDSVIDKHFAANTIAELTHQTKTPWLSVHLAIPYPKLHAIWQRLTIPFPIISLELAFRRAVANLKQLQALIDVPLLIENQAHYRRDGHVYLVQPKFINRLLDVAGVGLLLDIGHAWVSGEMLNMPDYIDQLSLDSVMELHVHRPGMYRGHLRDLHLPLQSADLTAISKLLPSCPNLRAITLEYYGPAHILKNQLGQLRALVDGYSAEPITMGSL